MAKEETLTLTNAHIKGFKSIEDVIIGFKPRLNVLIGKNASGKSNLLEALNQILSDHNNTKAYRSAKIDFVSTSNKKISFTSAKTYQKPDNEKINIIEDQYKETVFTNNVNVSDGSGIAVILYRKKILFPFPSYMRFHIPDNLDYVANPGSIKIDISGDYDSWSHPKTLPFLRIMFLLTEMSFRGNIESVKKITQSSFYKKIKLDSSLKNNLRKFSPIQDIKFNKNINLYKDTKSVVIENIKIDFKVNGQWLPWSQLSDGTKRLFYLISEVYYRYDGSLILLEEPELGIHPHQFHLVMQFLKEQAETKQIIISTHSPQALNYLNEDELSNILITKYDTKKGTQVKHLTKTQINKAKKYMKEVGFLSDYWMLSDLEE